MKFSYSYIIVLLAIIAVSQAEFCNLNFKECQDLKLKTGTSLGKVSNLSFNGTCSSEGFAVLKKGTVVEIDFQFQSYNPQATLKSVVHGQISGSPWLPFPLGNPDACKDSGLTCPIPANTTLNYKPNLKVLSSYPALKVLVKWQLQDARKADIFCVVLPAEIAE
ncbi:unnamed protein product [Candidula unifasciata]|uniref:MD-2-related lipid-recognition domain-containing protein n=1 Tax=Candidula unifasciata TaxID=100452 RepID=A0A8S3ZYN4_9EUPU|nr:unnamed protein product [Candidula unifasciata]